MAKSSPIDDPASRSEEPPWELPDKQWVAIFQTAVEHMDEGFTIFDRDLHLLAWNERFFSLLEFPLTLAKVGTPFGDFMLYNAKRGEYGPGDPDTLAAERVELARKFRPHSVIRRRPDGKVLEVRGNPIPGIGFVTVYKDITEQARAEAALKESIDTLELRVRERTAELRGALENLRQSEQWIRRIADAVPALIGYVDADKIYRFCNRGYQEWFGQDPEQVVGKPVWEVLGGELYPGHRQDLDEALSGVTKSAEFSLKLLDGHTIDCLVNYIPHQAQSGETLGYFILSQDITKLKRTETLLRQAQKMDAVGQLTGGIAHDFNNLLTIIVGNLALINEGEMSDRDIEPMIAPALDAARRGAALVNRLLAFSRKKVLRAMVYKPHQTILGMGELLHRTLGATIEVAIRTEGACWSVHTDPSELESAVLNLVINSRDAMPGGGKLEVSIGGWTISPEDTAVQQQVAPGDYVIVKVKDTGGGIPPDIQERVFEPFFTTKKPGQGTGLGLSMVYGFIRRSNGHIIIESEAGSGTQVSLYLPRFMGIDTVPIAHHTDAGATPGGSESILLVEDESAVRDFTAKVLCRLGYRVIEATDGSHALELVEKGVHFDLLLSDIEMPGGVSGIDLVRTIRRHMPKLKYLLMSGYPDKIMEHESFPLRDKELLCKPFDHTMLAERVRGALDSRDASGDGVER
ncbi:PAS-domain containing protein [Sedimenticola sp.]|uniref:PAS-domain containing protein n=1 Tax=Sedimenticola sp. TaxID=1940285 RepID=UPI003D0DA8EC